MRVLVPYMLAYGGGVRRVLSSGLPHLMNQPGIELEYAELCANREDMEDIAKRGVPVNPRVGVSGSGVISHRLGIGRRWDQLSAVPRLLRVVLRMRRWFKSGQAVYVHSYRDMIFTFAALCGLPARRRPAVVWHCHGLGDGTIPPALRGMAARCQRIIAVSNEALRQLNEARIDTSRARRVYNAVDVANISERSKLGPSTPLPAGDGRKVLLLPCAALRPSKGVHTAIEAVAAVGHGCDLWVTGSTEDPSAKSYLAQLVGQVERHRLGDRVHFIGARPDIYAVMARAFAVLVPSVVPESFGLVAAEAMALSKPVIASNRGALPEVVESGVSGLVFNAEDPHELADQISRLLTDPSLAARFAERGLDRVTRLFGYDRWAEEVALLIREAVGSSERPRALS